MLCKNSHSFRSYFGDPRLLSITIMTQVLSKFVWRIRAALQLIFGSVCDIIFMASK